MRISDWSSDVCSSDLAMKKYIAAAVLAAVAMPSAPALADPPPWAPAHGKRAKDRGLYDGTGRYYEPRRTSRGDRIWRGDDGRYRRRRDNGPTGLMIGAAGGARGGRSDEHTSELQSLMHSPSAVCC